MLTAVKLPTEPVGYWIYGHCPCGHLKDFITKNEGPPFKDVGFRCTRPGCGIVYTLNQLIASSDVEMTECDA